MPESLPLYVVDAFTDRPFSGNPAAVCLLPKWPADAWLQSVAAEMNLSETAYLVREGSGYRLRWFTPALEVELCGHATLASAHVLWDTGTVAASQSIDFTTLSGTLTAERNGAEIELNFPATYSEESPPAANLLEALGAKATFVGRNRFDYLVQVASEQEVRSLNPDFRLLSQVECRGVIVTAESEQEPYDFVSRFFAPGAGIDEDPVTGSAHCALGPFWQRRLGKSELRAFQASARGGSVGVVVEGDRVHLLGQAVTVTRGELLAVPD